MTSAGSSLGRPSPSRPAIAGSSRRSSPTSSTTSAWSPRTTPRGPPHGRRRVPGQGDAVVRYGGTLEKFIGDAVFAIFGVPVAHDDDALRRAGGARPADRAPGTPRAGSRGSGIGSGSRRRVVGPARRPATGPGRRPASGDPGRCSSRPPSRTISSTRRRATRRRRATVGPIDPSPAGRPSRSTASASSRHGGGPGGRPAHGLLVGRHRERERLRDLASTVATGRGRVVVVVGRPASGRPAHRRAGVSTGRHGLTWTENHSYLVGSRTARPSPSRAHRRRSRTRPGYPGPQPLRDGEHPGRPDRATRARSPRSPVSGVHRLGGRAGPAPSIRRSSAAFGRSPRS